MKTILTTIALVASLAGAASASDPWTATPVSEWTEGVGTITEFPGGLNPNIDIDFESGAFRIFESAAHIQGFEVWVNKARVWDGLHLTQQWIRNSIEGYRATYNGESVDIIGMAIGQGWNMNATYQELLDDGVLPHFAALFMQAKRDIKDRWFVDTNLRSTAANITNAELMHSVQYHGGSTWFSGLYKWAYKGIHYDLHARDARYNVISTWLENTVSEEEYVEAYNNQ